MCCRLSRYVAIKVCKSEQRHEEGGEASILRRLADGPATHAGKTRVVELLDQFESESPNGLHRCLVTEPLGPWLKSVLFLPGLSPEAAWEVARQLVEATAYMHAAGVAHGGAYVSNDGFDLGGSFEL